MKNIFKKFLIIFISLSLIFNITLVSNAVDEDVEALNNEEQVDESLKIDSSENNVSPDGDEKKDETDSLENNIKDAKIQKNYYYLGSDDLNITDDIYGDVYIITSGKVTISSKVEGNVFILASEVNLSENSEIDFSLYCISDNLTINGIIINNTYAIAQKFYLTENANLFKDLFLMADNIDISGSIDRDVNISGSNIVLSEYAYINGDFNYSSENEITIPEHVIAGQVNYSKITPSSNENSNNIILGKIFNILSYIVFVIIIFIILKWLNNKLINNSDKLILNIWKYVLYGILGLLITPFAIIILLLLGLTAKLALLLLALYFIVILLAPSVLIINLSNFLVQKFGKDPNTMKNVLCIALLCVVYKLLQFIISSIIIFAFIVVGFGIILKAIMSSKNSETNNI